MAFGPSRRTKVGRLKKPKESESRNEKREKATANQSKSHKFVNVLTRRRNRAPISYIVPKILGVWDFGMKWQPD